MKTILGIDPGMYTGLVVLTYLIDGHARWELGESCTSQFDTTGMARTFIREWRVNAVAIESFVVSGRAARSRNAAAGGIARDIIGAVKAMDVPVLQHNASTAKNWATNRRLEAMGIELPAASKHGARGGKDARDALRHALYAMHRVNWCPDPLRWHRDPLI